MRSDEVPASNRPGNYDGYCVTTHCFSSDDIARSDCYHGAASNLLEGSGRQSFIDITSNASSAHRPPDFIFDLVYAVNLYKAFRVDVSHVPPAISVASERLYPGGIVKQCEDRQGQQDEKERRERIEKQERERDERHASRQPQPDDDIFDHILQLTFKFKGVNEADISQHISQHEQSLKEAERQKGVAKVGCWRRELEML